MYFITDWTKRVDFDRMRRAAAKKRAKENGQVRVWMPWWFCDRKIFVISPGSVRIGFRMLSFGIYVFSPRMVPPCCLWMKGIILIARVQCIGSRPENISPLPTLALQEMTEGTIKYPKRKNGGAGNFREENRGRLAESEHSGRDFRSSSPRPISWTAMNALRKRG